MILVTILSLMVLVGRAQSNIALYNSNDQFNSPGFNPAFLINQQKFTFSIFPLSGMSVGYNNQETIKGMLKDLLSGSLDTTSMSIIFKSLLKRDLFSQRFETSLLNFGYHSKIGSFNFRINEIEQIRSGLKGDFTQFISNPAFQTIKLNQPQNLYADAVHYREYSLGYAREIVQNKLAVGLRAKIYFGKATLFSEVPGEVTTNNGSYYLETSGSIRTSLPLDFIINRDLIVKGANPKENYTVMNYLFNSKNLGTGIDLGLIFKVNPKILLSASVVDFGRINWDSDLNNMNLKGKIEILPKYIQDSGDDFLTKNSSFSSDSMDLNLLFKSVIDTTTVYSTVLPTSYIVSMQYQVKPKLNIGLVDRYIQSKGMNQNSISLTAKYEVNKKLTLISGYSAIGKSYNNIPFALIYNWGSGQSYLGTDNLVAFFIPSMADYTGISFGTCFYLFKPKDKYRQIEYLPFFQKKSHKIFNN